MSATAFAELICSKVRAAIGTNGIKYSKETPALAQQAIADGITEYFLAHVKANISYTGVMNASPHGADPVVSDVMKISGKCEPTPAPKLFDLWVRELQTNIANGFSVNTIGQNGVMVTFKPFNSVVGSLTIPRNNLRIAHENNRKDPMQKTWEVICQAIMDWINSSASIMPLAKDLSASRSVSTGKATLVKNVID